MPVLDLIYKKEELRKLKKSMSLFIIIVLFISTLSGCSTYNADDFNSPSQASDQVSEQIITEPVEKQPESTNEQQAQLPEESVSIQEQPQEVLLDSEKAIARVSYEMPLFDGEQVSIWYPIRAGRATYPEKDSDDAIFWKLAQGNLGMNIVWVEIGQVVATEQYNLMIAGGDYCDIIYEGLSSRSGSAYAGGYDKAIEDDVYLDLSEYVEEYCPNYYYWININEDARKAAYTDTGKIGSFSTIYVEPQQQNMGMVVNADYLDATRLDMPNTIDGWLEVFEAMKANGVEYPCVSGSSGSLLQGYLENAMGATLNTQFVLDVATGELVFGPTTDATRAYIELAAEIYEKGYVDPGFINIVSNDPTPFRSGLVGTWESMGQEISTYRDNYGIGVYACPVIIGEGLQEGQFALGSLSSDYVSDMPGMAVTTSCENLEVTLTFMDWFYSEEGALISNYGWVEGLTYEIIDGKYRSLPYMNESDPKTGVSMKGLHTLVGDFGLVYTNISLENADKAQQDAAEKWTGDTDFNGYTYMTLPGALALTAEESDAVASKFTDIETTVNSYILRWIVGEDELTDASWATFIATLDTLGIDECYSAYLAAFERYNNK